MAAPTMTRPRVEQPVTPLGPGGRPFARWRWVVTLLALAALGAVVVVMLSDRAPGFLGNLTTRVVTRVDRAAPDATGVVQQAVAGTKVEERDVQAHILLWSTATVFVGLAMWSWRSLTAAVLAVAGAATALELVQNRFAPSRIVERSDLYANGAGIALGVIAVVAITAVTGLPARHRRRALQRSQR